MKFTHSLKKAKPATRRGRVARTLPSDLVEKRAVLKYRCKRMGWAGKTPADLIKANKEHLSCEAGIAIEKAGFTQDRWNFVKQAQSIYARYHSANGTNVHPKGATIEMQPEYQVGGPDDGPVKRPTEEERIAMDIQAVRNWDGLQGQLLILSKSTAKAFNDCVDNDHIAGPEFIKALDAVVKGLHDTPSRAKRIMRGT